MPPAPGPFRGEFSRMLSQDHFMYDSINSNKSENNETYNNSDYFQTNKTYQEVKLINITVIHYFFMRTFV